MTSVSRIPDSVNRTFAMALGQVNVASGNDPAIQGALAELSQLTGQTQPTSEVDVLALLLKNQAQVDPNLTLAELLQKLADQGIQLSPETLQQAGISVDMLPGKTPVLSVVEYLKNKVTRGNSLAPATQGTAFDLNYLHQLGDLMASKDPTKRLKSFGIEEHVIGSIVNLPGVDMDLASIFGDNPDIYEGLGLDQAQLKGRDWGGHRANTEHAKIQEVSEQPVPQAKSVWDNFVEYNQGKANQNGGGQSSDSNDSLLSGKSNKWHKTSQGLGQPGNMSGGAGLGLNQGIVFVDTPPHMVLEPSWGPWKPETMTVTVTSEKPNGLGGAQLSDIIKPVKPPAAKPATVPAAKPTVVQPAQTLAEKLKAIKLAAVGPKQP